MGLRARRLRAEFDVALGFALQAAAGLDAVEIAVDVELEQDARVISRASGGCWVCTTEAQSE